MPKDVLEQITFNMYRYIAFIATQGMQDEKKVSNKFF